MRRAIGFLGLHKRAVAIAVIALLIATLAQLVVPKLTQNMINQIIGGAQAQAGIENPLLGVLQGKSPEQLQQELDLATTLLIQAALLIVGFAIMRAAFSFIQTYMAEYTSQGLAFNIRNELFAKIQRLSFSYHDSHQTGQLMTRATSDVENLRTFISQGLLLAVQALLLLVTTLAILLLTNWRLTLVIIPILPVSMGLFMMFGKIIQPLFGEFQQRVARLNTVLQENVAGIRVVKAFVRQNYEQQRFVTVTDDYFAQSIKIGRTMAFLFPLIFTIAQIGQVAILYFAAPLILNGEIGLGEYQEFTLYLLYLFFPIGQLGIIISLMAQASASAERIFEVLDTEADVQDRPGAVTLPFVTGNVELRNVSFKYFSSSGYVLKDVNLTVESGMTVALLGATGSGKTSIINLIPRFYDVTEGAVLIDGHDIRDVTIDSLRSQIGIVLQETNLFSGTIRDNIAFGRPDASEEEVIEAARSASAYDFIMSFPDGFNTAVGERGATLSGGQKQRLAIARALLLKPRILIMDDSTSAVDFETERKIQGALDTLMQGRTSFVIAQRISTVRNADLIVILDKGEVVATGKHTELMETSPIYAEIFSSQLVDDAAPQGVN